MAADFAAMSQAFFVACIFQSSSRRQLRWLRKWRLHRQGRIKHQWTPRLPVEGCSVRPGPLAQGETARPPLIRLQRRETGCDGDQRRIGRRTQTTDTSLEL